MMRISSRFLDGFARAFDVYSSKRRFPDLSYDPMMEDYKALKGDWEIVGKEIKEAVDAESKRLAVY